MIEAYPLHWPPSWKRTDRWYRVRSRFNTGMAKARDNLIAELDRLGASDVIISTNIALRRDGLPYAGQREPEDPAVAVYFKLHGKDQCFPCDKWDRVQDNIHAIGKTIEALRGLDRWGAKEMVDAAFRGFEALPPPSDQRSWKQVLFGMDGDGTLEDAENAYRRLSFEAHPDQGGDVAQMAELNRAIAEAREHFR